MVIDRDWGICNHTAVDAVVGKYAIRIISNIHHLNIYFSELYQIGIRRK